MLMLMPNIDKDILQGFKMKAPQIMKQNVTINGIDINFHFYLFCKREKKTIKCIIALRC